MSWIKLHANAFAHPKTRRMATRLAIPPAAAVGHLASLWTWALEYAPTGELAGFEIEELEIAAGWNGEDGAFVDAAIVAGYLDSILTLDGRPALGIHDWDDYAGLLLDRRERNRERMRRTRSLHMRGTQRARAGLEKSREELNHTSSAEPADDGFASFWTAYPRKVGKTAALKRWRAMTKRDRTTALAAAAQLAAQVRATNRELRFIPHPATFIGPARHFEDWAEGIPAGYEGSAATAPRRDICPKCEMDVTFDERGAHCPVCDWRPA